MSRRFPLQTVERLRSVQLDRAAHQLGAARARVLEAETGLQALQSELAACIPAATSTAEQVSAVAARRDLLRDNIERAKGELVRLRTEAAAAVAAWSAARAGLRAVESLHDRHRIAQAEAELRREQLLTDELASVLSSFPGTGRLPALGSPAQPGPRPGGDAA